MVQLEYVVKLAGASLAYIENQKVANKQFG